MRSDTAAHSASTLKRSTASAIVASINMRRARRSVGAGVVASSWWGINRVGLLWPKLRVAIWLKGWG